MESISIIKSGQAPSGAYIACPNFPTYHFAWLRDGSFIAHAMDLVNETESASAFFQWVGRTINRYEYKLDNIRSIIQLNQPIHKDDFLHTRFTTNGDEVTDDPSWGNFQIDGYGTWLWALGEHLKKNPDSLLLNDLAKPIHTTLTYLHLCWRLPNYDCWEEFPEYIHPYSLASVFAGLSAMQALVAAGQLSQPDFDLENECRQIQAFLYQQGITENRFAKHIDPQSNEKPDSLPSSNGVDSSLLALGIPYAISSLDDPFMQNTFQQIVDELSGPGGGVYRYRKDDYYGGGQWILLTAWVAWYYTKLGNYPKALELKQWIEQQADQYGFLAEQCSSNLLFKDQFDPWLKKWGPPATPLLWSHAMYIILTMAIREGSDQ